MAQVKEKTELERLRVLRGFESGSALARKIGVSHTALRGYEKGEMMPNLDIAMKYAEILGITVAELRLMIERVRLQAKSEADKQAATIAK